MVAREQYHPITDDDRETITTNNNAHSTEQCSIGSLNKRYKHKPDTKGDTSQSNTTHEQLQSNVKTRCPAFAINGQVKASNCCTKRADWSCFGSDNFGIKDEFDENKSECNNVHHMTSMVDREFRSVNQDESKDYQEDSQTFPEYLKNLNEGRKVCGDTYVKFSKPDWFNKEKFQRGQRFAINHFFSVMFAKLISMLMMWSNRGGLEPLIFTGMSDTPFKAFKRYLSTIVYIKSWYEGDIWDEESDAHKKLKAARSIHEAVRKNMQGGAKHEVAKRITLEGDGSDHRPLWTDLHEEIVDDFRSSCPFSKTPMTKKTEVYINQYDMAITQFGFLGLILLFPKKLGVHFATEEDFEGFSHYWRTIGFLLGMDDRYNLCNGDLQTVRQQCADMNEYIFKPALRDVSRQWLHMSRCAFKGVSFYFSMVTFEVMVLYLCNVLDIKATRLTSALTLWQSFWYNVIVNMFRLFRMSSILRLCNYFFVLGVKIALKFGPKHMMKLEQMKYPYETAAEINST